MCHVTLKHEMSESRDLPDARTSFVVRPSGNPPPPPALAWSFLSAGSTSGNCHASLNAAVRAP